ncbi:MAG: hypothetical protein ACE5GX_07660 [Thermoanaerobaculia bacterium]
MIKKRVFGAVTISTVLALAGAARLWAEEPLFRSFNGSQTTTLDCSVKARLFPDVNLAFFTQGFSTQDGSENSIRCTARVRNEGQARKGVKLRLEGEIVPLDDIGDTVVSLPTKSGKTDRDGNLEIEFPLDDLPDDDLAVIIEGTFTTRKRMDFAKVECASRNRMPCQAGPETLCLLDDERFKVEVDWRSSSSDSGSGMLSSSSFDTGSFYFINPNSTDLVVQLLNACSNNDHFWVFLQASTRNDITYDLTVTDTATGSSRVYENELGQVAQAITDTSAFATCP